DNCVDVKKHTEQFIASARTKLSDYIKSHRDIHLPISKFGKLVDKSPDDLLRLVIIEHLLREGHQSLAVDLMHNFGFTEEEIRLEKFKELSNLVSCTQKGELDPGRR
ncbi:unnamed protein product, partial [Trichobilharzia regenti]